jgi:hypothetical protein
MGEYGDLSDVEIPTSSENKDSIYFFFNFQTFMNSPK